MTGQDILNTMEILDPELQLQPGEAGVTKGLLALNVAQDHLESLLAEIPNVLGSATDTWSVTNAEYVVLDADMLRLDKLQIVSQSTGFPIKDLHPLYNVGGHASYPVVSDTPRGEPEAYWTNGTRAYLTPIPISTYHIRPYGFWAAADITASGTFAYKDIARLPLATFAVKLISVGLDDPQNDLMDLARETFSPVLKTYERFRRESGKGYQYRYSHDT